MSLHSHPVSCPCLCVAATQDFPCDLYPVELLGSQTKLWGTRA